MASEWSSMMVLTDVRTPHIQFQAHMLHSYVTLYNKGTGKALLLLWLDVGKTILSGDGVVVNDGYAFLRPREGAGLFRVISCGEIS